MPKQPRKPPTARQTTAQPVSIALLASGMFAYRLCAALVHKGVLTDAEAANVFVQTAHDIRSGTEDGGLAALGEGIATRYETFAAWMLGHKNPGL